MSAAIRAQRERHAAPKTIAAAPAEPPEPDKPSQAKRPPKRLSYRLRGK